MCRKLSTDAPAGTHLAVEYWWVPGAACRAPSQLDQYAIHSAIGALSTKQESQQHSRPPCSVLCDYQPRFDILKKVVRAAFPKLPVFADTEVCRGCMSGSPAWLLSLRTCTADDECGLQPLRHTQQLGLSQDHRPGSFEVILHHKDEEFEIWSKLLTGGGVLEAWVWPCAILSVQNGTIHAGHPRDGPCDSPYFMILAGLQGSLPTRWQRTASRSWWWMRYGGPNCACESLPADAGNPGLLTSNIGTRMAFSIVDGMPSRVAGLSPQGLNLHMSMSGPSS